jgi:hypothetical protein
MTLADLQKILQAADRGAVLVSPRILERVIREECRLPNMYWNIPHARSYVCDRQVLFRHAEQADLELEPDQLLPETVILLARPDLEELNNLERKMVLLKYWRRLFHARVHMALDNHAGPGPLASEDAVRERIVEIGRTEFEEIRTVLYEDRFLPPEPDDRTVYIEFAAVYLEMRYFAHNLLTNYFPGMRDFGRVERLLGRDVDAAQLFIDTRLRDAPDPIMPADTRSDESQEAYWKLVRSAQRAALAGNTVGAAILRMRASRIAPAAQTLPTRNEAEADIAHLSKRLAAALSLSDAEAADWTRHLTLLLDKADQGARTTEARVLEDLQQVCLDHERDVYTLDLVEYLMSGGKRPIKRPLPSQRLVRITKHLHAAASKLGEVRLAELDRNHLARLVQASVHKSEAGLRARFGPVLVTALEDVGLKARTPIERAAFDKMVGELLDRITNYGFLTFAELRDTISRNQLKLADLGEPEDFLRGDPLIRLDRRLASLLDGVYRPGEFYTRYLERGTSLLFGTNWGRALSRYVLLPVLCAWLVLHVLGLLVGWLFPYPKYPFMTEVSLVLLGPVHHVGDDTTLQTALGAAGGVTAVMARRLWPVPQEPHWLWHVGVLIPTAILVLALIQSNAFRRRCLRGLVALGRALQFVFWRVPLRFLPLGTIRRIIATWMFQLLYWYVLKPGLVCVLLWWPFPDLFSHWYSAGATFLVVLFLLNSRIGRGVSEGMQDVLVNLGTMVRAGLIPGMIRLTLHVFKQVVESIEYVLFVVDEWLRFRSGGGRTSLVVRTLLGVVWYPIAFLARFYMVVLIEPGINPVKLPLSIIMAKVLLPIYPVIYGFALQPLEDALGSRWLARAIIAFHIFWLPDVFVFLVWEIKENWSLYRANRGAALRPVPVGSHGETVRGLLYPGFHSGTIPAVYARLRQAERAASKTRNWHAVRAYRHELEEVAETLRNFVAREMVALLRQAHSWRGAQVEVGQVHLATNRIRIELTHADHPVQPVEIQIEHHGGWLLAGVRATGWLEEVGPERLRAFTLCLAGLYKRGDVDLVREQIRCAFPGMTSFQVAEDALFVWTDPHGGPLRYPLRDNPKKDDLPPANAVAPDPKRLIFARTPILWANWVECWEKDQDGAGQPGLPGLGESLVCLTQPAAPAAPAAEAPHPAPAPEVRAPELAADGVSFAGVPERVEEEE